VALAGEAPATEHEEGLDPLAVKATSSFQRAERKEKRPAERLSSVSGGDDDDSDGIELGHGGGFGHWRGEKGTGEGEEDGG
jgi:hypothetical protein